MDAVKMYKVEYKTVDTRTLQGFKQAEKLKMQGWTIGSVGFSTIEFYKLKGQ